MLKFIYKDKEYSWEEWNKEYEDFISELEMPGKLMVSPIIGDMASMYDNLRM